jgi:hypothetical protein
MARVKYLYGIVDVTSSALVYVGQTFHPRQRYREHLRGKLSVDQWIREQHSQGKKPEMTIIDRRCSRVNDRERELIALASKQSNFILNRKGVPA